MVKVWLQRAQRLYGDPREWARVLLARAASHLFGIRCGTGLAVSVVIPVRNRKGLRLRNTLQSLLRQSMPRENYELIVVDFDGNDLIGEWLMEIDASIRCIRCEEKGLFNEARAKNIGINAANAEIVCCTNADIVFAENFLETIYLAAKPPRRLLVECNRYNLEKEDVERLGERLPSEFHRLVRERKAWLTTWARGDCQAFRKAFIQELGGYDEDFLGWGYLDLDLERRCLQAGWKTVMLNTLTMLVHQGHEPGGRQAASNRTQFEQKAREGPVRNQSGNGKGVRASAKA